MICESYCMLASLTVQAFHKVVAAEDEAVRATVMRTLANFLRRRVPSHKSFGDLSGNEGGNEKPKASASATPTLWNPKGWVGNVFRCAVRRDSSASNGRETTNMPWMPRKPEVSAMGLDTAASGTVSQAFKSCSVNNIMTSDVARETCTRSNSLRPQLDDDMIPVKMNSRSSDWVSDRTSMLNNAGSSRQDFASPRSGYSVTSMTSVGSQFLDMEGLKPHSDDYKQPANDFVIGTPECRRSEPSTLGQFSLSMSEWSNRRSSSCRDLNSPMPAESTRSRGLTRHISMQDYSNYR